jgi:DNA-binding transcriptional regulator YhcF (GntR family)
MLLRIDFETDRPIYQQIRDQIVEGIAGGALTPGARLPSVRQLAADLDINLQTANKAYAILQAEGFLTVHRREGFIVRAFDEMRAAPGHLRDLERKLRPLAAEALCRGLSPDEFAGLCRAASDTVKKGEGR